jgi:hypothetical protein
VTGCTTTSAAVCACDGVTDAHECEANGRQQDTSSAAQCNPPAFGYRCGDVFCVTGTPFAEFCVRHTSAAGAPTYSCENAFDFQCVAVSCGADAGCNPHGCTCSPLSGGALLDCP